MQEIKEFNHLQFANWNAISYKHQRINPYWGKTYFYYDKAKDKLYCENFSPITAFFHRLFGYKKEFNRDNFWQFLQTKKLVQGESPKKGDFRKIVGDTLGNFCKIKTEVFRKIQNWDISNEEIIQMLDKVADLNSLYHNGHSILFEAVSGGHYEIVKYLLQRGVCINSANRETGLVARTPLQAALSIGHEKLVLLLLENGADVNAKDAYENTALHLAIKNLSWAELKKGSLKTFHYKGEEQDFPKNPQAIIQAILKKNPQINATNQDGNTPLYLACSEGSLETVTSLVEQGADVNASGKYERPPLIAAIDKDLNIVRYLVEKGAEINFSKKVIESRGTALNLAIEAKSRNKASNDLIAFLVEKGANVQQGGGYFKIPPLSTATRLGDQETVQFLIAHGADINGGNWQNRTALFEAVEKENLIIMEFLLSQGANPNIRDIKQKTALDISKELGHHAISTFLETKTTSRT